jgi:hypothetical protein
MDTSEQAILDETPKREARRRRSIEEKRRIVEADEQLDSRDSEIEQSEVADRQAAAIYSLVGSAKLNGIDPERYLRDVLSRISDHPIKRIEELLPWNVAASLKLPIREAA